MENWEKDGLEEGDVVVINCDQDGEFEVGVILELTRKEEGPGEDLREGDMEVHVMGGEKNVFMPLFEVKTNKKIRGKTTEKIMHVPIDPSKKIPKTYANSKPVTSVHWSHSVSANGSREKMLTSKHMLTHAARTQAGLPQVRTRK
jgi:hypothetical protein